MCGRLLAVLPALLLGLTAAQEPPAPLWFDPASAGDPLGSFRLTRPGRVITVQQFAPQAEGGQFRTNVPNCEAGVRVSTVYAPRPYAVVTQVAGTSIVSAVVLAQRPEGEDAAETLTMFAGSVSVDDSFCPVDVSRSGEPEVFILQGHTRIIGTELSYDNGSGLADLTGPVRLLREPGEGAPSITASAETLSFDTATDLSTLSGNVVVSSETRTSYADSLILDEEAGVATLVGDPARSVDGSNEIRGQRLLYFLDSDDVIVEGGVSGTIELELR